MVLLPAEATGVPVPAVGAGVLDPGDEVVGAGAGVGVDVGVAVMVGSATMAG